ncbi:DUF934 domain-containing protein [Ensifer sp. ENS07]|uniref:DUF934 domain-containing protein n=1 Tax=unclassified Ensifer TaxID=2633371 RepID=UPI00177F514F|nr:MULTISPECIES: DUF934 domain-containing protein [unclassified Ensifer]MBD9508033.1 DUF934 domain-containing protein [Ensifer sp. ENS10]MBD9637471.1 DUF934 domain-containing protein [Ensifer sp. ENS07]
MAVINGDAEVIVDYWTYPETDAVPHSQGPYAVPCEVLEQMRGDGIFKRPLGVYVSAGMTAERIVPFLKDLELIVVEFPKFRDGRGFTVARTLRERHQFKGDIRAIGHVLPDQLNALRMCGFSSIVTPQEHPPSQWQHRVGPHSATDSSSPLLRRLLVRSPGA